MKQSSKPRFGLLFARLLFTALLFYSVWFIFSNSLEIGNVSADRSEQVQQLVNTAAQKVGAGPFSLLQIRKAAHFTEFAALGFWFMLCLRVYTKQFIRHISWPLFLCLLTAVLDETVQLFVPGRASSTKDVLIDFAGSCCGLFAALLLLIFAHLCYCAFTHRKEVSDS